MAELVKPKKGFVPATSDDFKSHLYILSNRNDSPTLEGCHYPRTKILPSVDEVYMSWIDKNGEKVVGNRLLRYVPGELSIFADEQSFKEVPKGRLGDIRFTDGFLVVNGRNKLLRQFLDLCNWNRANADFRMDGKSEIFYKENKEESYLDIIDNKKKIHELEGIIFESSEVELDAYCMTFDVRGYSSMNVNEKRTAILDLIRIDPKRFETEMNSPERKRKYWVMKAFEETMLQLSPNRSEIQYTVGGIKTVCEIPSINTDPIEFLTDLSFKIPEINELMEKITKVLKFNPIANKTNLVPTESDNEYERLYKDAIEYKVLYKAGPWTKFVDKELQDIGLGKSMAEFEEIMKESNEIYQKINMMVTQAKELRNR